MSFLPRRLLIALQFLTTLPIRLAQSHPDEERGGSLPYYPLVGLLIGALLAAASWGLRTLPTNLAAALLLAFWILLTGALHLDGLADSADAWLGGIGDRERTLAIMKDPTSGPAAVVSLIVVLLLKFCAVEVLMGWGDWRAMAAAPLLGRTAPVLLFLTTPYVRATGLGNALSRHQPRGASLVVIALAIAAVGLLGEAGLWQLLAAAVTFLALRTLMQRRLGGTSGDTAGALVEITETAALVVVAVVG